LAFGLSPRLSGPKRPGNDRNGVLSKLRVCISPAVDNTAAAVDTMTAVAIVTTTTTAAINNTTTAVIDTTIAGGGCNSLSTTDDFDTEPYRTDTEPPIVR
jgi:hypothetical protein